MSKPDGLICAYLLDGHGSGRLLDWHEVQCWAPDTGVLWVHLDRSDENMRRWLRTESGLEPLMCDALLVEEVRPRATSLDTTLLVILRGVNLNPGADPEDMVSVRLWLDANRIISVRMRRLMAVEDIRSSLAHGTGPRTPGDFLAHIAERLIERMGPVVADIDDQVDAAEDQVLEAQSGELRVTLGGLRRQAIMLRRYLAPQRDVLARLQVEQLKLLDNTHRMRLRETADRVTRYVEDLDAARERAALTQEQLSSRLSEQMNQTMYILSVVAAIFLPLGLLTGLLGINVGGIPGTESPWAFTLVTVLLVAIAGVLVCLFRRRKLF
jgi:zinc transporter